MRNLSRFLSYIDQVQYPALADFSNERLNQITDKELHRFLCFLAYGKENPGKEDHSTEARSNTVLHYKKSISFFIPRRNQPWDPEEKKGNPCRSDIINDLIKDVKQDEARGLGKPSQARREFSRDEFENYLS